MAHWHFFVDVAQAVVSKTDLFKCEFSDLKGFIFGGPYPPLPYQFLRRKGLSVDLLPIVSKYHLVIIMLRAPPTTVRFGEKTEEWPNENKRHVLMLRTSN